MDRVVRVALQSRGERRTEDTSASAFNDEGLGLSFNGQVVSEALDRDIATPRTSGVSSPRPGDTKSSPTWHLESGSSPLNGADDEKFGQNERQEIRASVYIPLHLRWFSHEYRSRSFLTAPQSASAPHTAKNEKSVFDEIVSDCIGSGAPRPATR